MDLLIVDDSKAIRFKLKGFVEALGHRVVAEASNGIEAIEAYRFHKPDLVTLDIVMPEMDGLTTLAELRRIDPRARVIMVTSAAAISNMMAARQAGALHFLIKPFTKEKVEEVMSLVTSSQEAA